MTITAPSPRTRLRTQPRVQPRGPQRSTPSEAAPQAPGAERPRVRSAASQRAYARKAQRAGVAVAREAAPARRAPFVLLVMVLLAVGLIVSLWLSTAAAADSYRLEQARLQARELSERSEVLRQEVANLQTAPELARRARELGMVPTGEPARLVRQPDGTVLVVGKPAPATAPPPPAPPAPQAPAQPPAGQPAAGQPAVGEQPAPPAGAQPQPAPDPAAPPAGGG